MSATAVGHLPLSPSRRQHPHLVAATDDPAGQLDSLRLMLLKDEPEGATLGQRSDLGF